MRTVGEYLKEVRLEKRISLGDLERETKIKKAFLEAIERNAWDNLPDYPVVMGFVRNISLTLGQEPGRILALLRRDYPPKGLAVNPKPDVSKNFNWNPKLTFTVGIGIVIFVLLAYLVYQYISFVKPPTIEITSPLEGELVENRNLTVKGKTNPEATLKINNQPVLLEEDGQFTAEIEVSDITQGIEVVARSRAGKEAVKKRGIIVKLK